MFEEVLLEQNPFWEEPLTIKENLIVRRKLKTVTSALDLRQIIVITGIRRSGKSTLLKKSLNYLINTKKINPKNILYLNLNPHILKSTKMIPNI